MDKYSKCQLLPMAIVSLAIAVVSDTTESFAQEVIGDAVRVDDTVSGSRSGVLNSSSSIRSNETIKSNRTGLGHFEFKDGTKMVVGPDANLVLDENVYDPNQNQFKKFVITTTSGATRMITGNTDSSNFEIKTPVGILGIRGTAFEMQHYRGRTYVMILDGSLEICSNSGNCQSLSVPCSYTMITTSGNVLAPMQPRNGMFESRDMGRYFPLVNNNQSVQPDYGRVLKRCAGGNDGRGGGGASGDGPTPGTPGTPGGGNTGGGDTSGGDIG